MSYSSWGNPYRKLSEPSVFAPERKIPEVPKMTEFTYESWTIHFLEQEPWSWFVTHVCPISSESAPGHIGIGFKQTDAIQFDSPGEVAGDVDKPEEKELFTGIKCNICKEVLPKYTYLILRRTQKFMMMGKRSLKQHLG